MIVVAGGSSTRFGDDKLMTPVAGLPLVAHTVLAVAPHVDLCVLVCRRDQIDALKSLDLPARIVPGGQTRTASEMAGLAALEDVPDVIGIHDGARPVVSAWLVTNVLQKAAEIGGAIPLVPPSMALVTRDELTPLEGVAVAQTPQAFSGSVLMAAYQAAARVGFEGHDTADVIREFSDQTIAAVDGDSGNIKVTFPEDLCLIRDRLEDSSRTSPG